MQWNMKRLTVFLSYQSKDRIENIRLLFWAPWLCLCRYTAMVISELQHLGPLGFHCRRCSLCLIDFILAPTISNGQSVLRVKVIRGPTAISDEQEMARCG
jgi:hypothetical protein